MADITPSFNQIESTVYPKTTEDKALLAQLIEQSESKSINEQ